MTCIARRVPAFFVCLSAIVGLLLMAPRPSAAQATAISAGDIVQTNVNGQMVVGEVIRSGGGTADLNLGQNNVSRFVQWQYLKVVQRAGTGEKTPLVVGDAVQVPSFGNTLMGGRIMKVNGAYCEIDSSGSGFTGWTRCAEVRSPKLAGRAAATAPAGPSKPPKPGLVSCTGKFEGRYANSSGLPGLTLVFKAGKVTAKGPLVDDEEFECWTNGKKIYLHKPGQDDLDIDVNDDGTLDTPMGELKKKGAA